MLAWLKCIWLSEYPDGYYKNNALNTKTCDLYNKNENIGYPVEVISVSKIALFFCIMTFSFPQ